MMTAWRRRRGAILVLVVAAFLLQVGQASAKRANHPARRNQKLPVNVDPADPRWVLMLGDRARAELPKGVRQKAVEKFGLKACAVRPNFLKRHNDSYSCVIPSRDRVPFTVADQKHSGRCWIFAANRVIDSMLSTRGIKSDAVSPSFINYHSIRDQVSGLLERGATSDKPRLPELRRFVETKGWGYLLSEGGWMSWAMEAIKKHGMVPEKAMPTTADGGNSSLIFEQARALVTEAYQKMDQAKTPAARQRIKRSYLAKTEQLLDATLGRPPKDVEVKNSRGKKQKLSPKEYMTKHLRLSESDFDVVTLIHHPGVTRNRRIRLDDGLVRSKVEMYNVSMDVMQRATKKTLRKGEAVWFATNGSMLANPYAVDPLAAQAHNGKGEGVLSRKAFDYSLFVPSAQPDKGTRMNLDLGASNHAMALIGYDTAKSRRKGSGGSRTVKWLVENSWGSRSGDGGLLHMYDDYFKGHVDVVAVPRGAVPKTLLEKIERKPPVDWRASAQSL
jgi:bleomycin hydrolase